MLDKIFNLKIILYIDLSKIWKKVVKCLIYEVLNNKFKKWFDCYMFIVLYVNEVLNNIFGRLFYFFFKWDLGINIDILVEELNFNIMYK